MAPPPRPLRKANASSHAEAGPTISAPESAVPARVALLLDGGYVTKRHMRLSSGKFPSSADILVLCTAILAKVPDRELYRVFFYDCDPYAGTEILFRRVST